MDIDAMVDGLIKNNNLSSLMNEESKLFRQIRMLNSEFHTLLYENYNKLISAAQIIGKMSNNFDSMEQDIQSLSANMEEIIKQSDHLSSNLSDKFNNLSKLSSTHLTLKRLQFSSDLNDLVVINGQNFAKTLIESIEADDWMTSQRPRHVRPVIIKLIEDLSAISDNLAQYCDDGPHIPPTGQPTLYTNRNSKINNPMMNNIKKLFSERIEIFGEVSFSRRIILSGMIKIALKAMVESIRMQTFNKNGLQQLEIDVKYLQHELSRFVSDENVMFALLDEAVISAETRSLPDL